MLEIANMKKYKPAPVTIEKKDGILVFVGEYSEALEKTYNWSWPLSRQRHQYHKTWKPKEKDIIIHTRMNKEEKSVVRKELFESIRQEA